MPGFIFSPPGTFAESAEKLRQAIEQLGLQNYAKTLGFNFSSPHTFADSAEKLRQAIEQSGQQKDAKTPIYTGFPEYSWTMADQRQSG